MPLNYSHGEIANILFTVPFNETERGRETEKEIRRWIKYLTSFRWQYNRAVHCIRSQETQSLINRCYIFAMHGIVPIHELSCAMICKI